MTNATLTHRLARRSDIGDLRELVDAAISELQKPFLEPGQIESSRAIMGLDTQLLDDGTYFVVEVEGKLAGGADGAVAPRSMVETSRRDAMLPCSIRQRTQHEFGPCTLIRSMCARA